MRVRLIQYYNRISGSYWFVPGVMAISAALLALGLIQIDLLITPSFFGSNPFFFAAQPDGARSILNAIGGSMIGVAGTVFSVTMAAVVFASSSYGPRLLTNFMNDRGNQVTLGVFVATFVYSMLVLRSVRDASSEGTFAGLFVPNVAIYGAILLAICSIGVLIYFIHHVPSNIHISNVVSGIGKTLIERIEKTFPSRIGRPAREKSARDAILWQLPNPFQPDAIAENPPSYGRVCSVDNGYIEVIDDETLMRAAADHNIVVRMHCRPGIFVHRGTHLFDAWPAERLTIEAEQALLASLALGNARTPSQDLLFLVDELAEIAARALSPGVNDPFTAVNCMDWLGAAYAEFLQRDTPDPLRVDDDGKLRVVAQPIHFATYLEQGLGHIRQYAASDMIAATHFIHTLAGLVVITDRQDLIASINEQKFRFVALAQEGLHGASLEVVEEASRTYDRLLVEPVSHVFTDPLNYKSGV